MAEPDTSLDTVVYDRKQIHAPKGLDLYGDIYVNESLVLPGSPGALAASASEMAAGAITNKWANPATVAVIAEKYDVRRSGAVSDGVADDTTALQNAADIVKAVGKGGSMLLGRNHLVSGEISVGDSTLIEGIGGNGVRCTTVTSSALTGPVFRITRRASGIKGIKIASTAGRRAASTTNGHGVFVDPGDSPTPPSVTRIMLSDLFIVDQPTDGLHTIGTVELSKFEQITVTDCIRHGFVHDGGTRMGYSNLNIPPFFAKWIQCRAIECGGQGLIVQSSGGNSAQRCHFEDFESLGCAWDATKRYTSPGIVGSELYQVIFGGGRGLSINGIDVEDQQYSASSTVGGKPRTALATPSKGVINASVGSVVLGSFFSSLVESWNQLGAGLFMPFPTIFAGTYGTLQNPAIIVPALANGGIDIRWLASMCTGASTVVRNQAINAYIEANGVPNIGDAFSAFDISDGITPTSVALVSDILTTTNRRTQVAGQGDLADNLSTIRLASGINGAIGMDIYLYRGGQDITVKHGTANIRTKTAADVVMTSTANTVLHFAYDGTNWIQI